MKGKNKDNVLERLTRLEEKFVSMDNRLVRLEKAMYGNSNPDSVLSRIARIEESQKLVLRLLVTNLGLVSITFILYLLKVLGG